MSLNTTKDSVKKSTVVAEKKDKSPKNKQQPLIQYAQKCAWCGLYLLGGDEISTYNGLDYQYKDWLCHKDCNLKDEF